MAEFLTTKTIAGRIDEIIRSAEGDVFLITPFLDLSDETVERLKEANERGVTITLVFQERGLKAADKSRLLSLEDVRLFDSPESHAKCYYNASQMVIGSMNLCTRALRASREMGIYLRKRTDGNLFRQAVREAESIRKSSRELDWGRRKLIAQPPPRGTKRSAEKEVKLAQNLGGKFYAFLLSFLKQRYPRMRFDVHSGRIFCQDFLLPGLVLNLEEKGSCGFRIDFRLPGDYSTRCKLYDLLFAQAKDIEKKIGHSVDWGSQMMRLKLDVEGFTQKPKAEWTEKDADRVIALLRHLERVVVPRIRTYLAGKD